MLFLESLFFYIIAYCIAYYIAYLFNQLFPTGFFAIGFVVAMVAGSWPGPAWFWLGFGLRGHLGGGGGGKGRISCSCIITFHWQIKKECCGYSFILTFRCASFGNEGIGKITYR